MPRAHSQLGPPVPWAIAGESLIGGQPVVDHEPRAAPWLAITAQARWDLRHALGQSEHRLSAEAWRFASERLGRMEQQLDRERRALRARPRTGQR